MPPRLLALASLLLLTCQPTGTPELVLTATPTEIADNGEETTLRVLALDGQGKIGKGKVKLTSAAGSLRSGVELELDAYGVATTPFSCAIADDPLCHDRVLVLAQWVTEKPAVEASVRVRILPPPPPPWERDVVWDQRASPTSCSGVTPPGPQPCTDTCPRGFTCVEGQCLLNGGSGGLQYTLRFTKPADVDLHLVEPIPDGGTCEVFYGDVNTSAKPSTCGARSSLDLDSNAGCRLDDVRVENIILPPGRPTPGIYTARIDLWSACMLMEPIPWELQVRAGSISRFYCGTFMPGDADQGGRGSGVTISTIIVPPPAP